MTTPEPHALPTPTPVSWNDTYNEIQEKEALRPHNSNPPMNVRDVTAEEAEKPKL